MLKKPVEEKTDGNEIEKHLKMRNRTMRKRRVRKMIKRRLRRGGAGTEKIDGRGVADRDPHYAVDHRPQAVLGVWGGGGKRLHGSLFGEKILNGRKDWSW